MFQSTMLSSPRIGLFLGPAPCVSEYDAVIGTGLFLGPAPCVSDYDAVIGTGLFLGPVSEYDAAIS